MSTKWFCDRCAKETPSHKLLTIKLGYGEYRPKDICTECVQSYEAWFAKTK